MRNFIKLAGCGFIMGLADLVPGISGGTVAFILGIWEQLILSIGSLGRSLLWFKNPGRTSFVKPLLFLCPLLLGIILAIFLFARGVDSLLNSPLDRVYLYSLFIGLIAASSILCLRSIKKWSYLAFTFFGLSLVAAVSMTYAKPDFKSLSASYHIPMHLLPAVSKVDVKNIDRERGFVTHVEKTTLLAMLAKGTLNKDHEVIDAISGSKISLSSIAGGEKAPYINLWIVFCGAAAVSAMLLPGISGSYLLVILGVYPEVIGNTADFISSLKSGSFDQTSFIFLAQFALGIVIGSGLFSKVIGLLFKRYHDVAMAALAGFVLGSLRAVWPFWTYFWAVDPLKMEKGARLVADVPLFKGQHEVIIPLLIGALGFLLVFLIEYLAKRKRANLPTVLEI